MALGGTKPPRYSGYMRQPRDPGGLIPTCGVLREGLAGDAGGRLLQGVGGGGGGGRAGAGVVTRHVGRGVG